MEVIRGAAGAAKPQLHPRDNLELDFGLDSMERIELLVALEREEIYEAEHYVWRSYLPAAAGGQSGSRLRTSDRGTELTRNGDVAGAARTRAAEPAIASWGGCCVSSLSCGIHLF
jgi:hypothetical protein